MSFLSRSSKIGGNDRGFTLIEVMIAMFLLVVISMGIYQATTQTYRLRDVLQNEGDFFNNIRLALNIMDRDITLLFSPIPLVPGVMTPPSQDENNANQTQTNVEFAEQLRLAQLDRESDFWNPAVDLSGIRPSRFVGTENSLSFIAASHIRLYRESPESEFAKITYRVSDEVAISDELKEALEDTSTLVKTEDPNAFDLEEDRRIEITGRRYRRTYPLLNGVRSIKFEYYRKQDDRWFREWDSLNREFLNQYPDIIRMTIVVVGPSRLFYEGIHLFKPEMPFYGLHPSY